MALRVPKQNRVAKITRVMLDLTRLTVALPSLENRRPSCVPRLSTNKRLRRQSTAIQRDREPTSATCLSFGSFFGMARRLLSCEILTGTESTLVHNWQALQSRLARQLLHYKI